MSTLQFVWNSIGLLASQFATGFNNASIRKAVHGRPIAVTLWHADGRGLRIQSSMNDIAPRLQVGVLQFTVVDTLLADEVIVTLPASFERALTVEKLLIEESGVVAESGLSIVADGNEEIVVTAGAYPYTLAVSGLLSIPHIFEPEYPLDEYMHVNIK